MGHKPKDVAHLPPFTLPGWLTGTFSCPTTTPRLHFASPSSTYQELSTTQSQKGMVLEGRPWGVRRGHEDRAELVLLEVSRAGTVTNLQAPLLKCHPPVPLHHWGSQHHMCVLQDNGKAYTSLQLKARQSPQQPKTVPPLPPP